VALTSFDRRFDRWMEDPEFEAAYKQHRARIDAINEPMRGYSTKPARSRG
jgi:hypothetical protein